VSKFYQFVAGVAVFLLLLVGLLAGLLIYAEPIQAAIGPLPFRLLVATALVLLPLDVLLLLFNPYTSFVLKNLWRNLLRTGLTCVATMFLVLIITLVWTITWFLEQVTKEKSADLKCIVTERWQIPSQMPFSYASTLAEGGAREAGDARPTDHMTWQFYGGSIDPAKKTREGIVFFFGLDPTKIKTMMDDAENFPDELVARLVNKKNGALIGKERLAALNKRVGERFTVTSFNYTDLNLEFEIVGECPAGRYDQSAFMNRDYLNDALDDYKRKKGTPHPLASKTLNLVWLRVPDQDAFRRVAEQVMTSPLYTTPSVKCETASSGIASFLEAYKDLLNFMQYVLVPVALGTMMLVITNAISIGVRERRTEMAVLKVIGFGPAQIMMLVLSEALLLGAGSGLVSAAVTYFLVDVVFGGIKFPIAFFPAFYIPINALWWGLGIGMLTSLLGSALPAWGASSVRPSEVFAKVA